MHHHPERKPFYTLVEIAIRWCEYFNEEQAILSDVKRYGHYFPDHPCIAQRVAILRHAIDCGQMPYRIDGTPMDFKGQIRPGTPEEAITIDHQELKAWFERNEPTERPTFLFPSARKAPPRPREESLLNIIGAMINLMLDTNDEGKRLTGFASQDDIISLLVDRNPAKLGISRSNLEKMIAKAKESLRQT